jgi:hypothetical protein
MWTSAGHGTCELPDIGINVRQLIVKNRQVTPPTPSSARPGETESRDKRRGALDMRTIRVCQCILITVILAALPQDRLHGQLLAEYVFPDYETLEWLYESGQIDQDEFDRWNELFLDSLPHSIDSLDSTLIGETPPIVTQLRPAAYRIDYRIDQRADESDPYRHLIRIKSRKDLGIYSDLTAEKRGDGSFALRNRMLGWSDGSSTIELGGVDPVWCGGLVAGRHPILLKKIDRSRTALYPLKSRFNGLLAQTVRGNLTVATLASYDQGDQFSSSAFGGDIAYGVGRNSIEASILSGRIRNIDDGRAANIIAFGAGAGIVRRNSFAARLNTSFDGDGNGAFIFGLFSARRQHSFRVWHYDRDYTNPFGAGRANPDTRPVEIDEIDLEYRSRYADETGIQTRSLLPFSIYSLLVESNWWRSGVTEKYRVKLTQILKANDRNRLKLILLSGDDDLGRIGFDIYTAYLQYRNTGLSFGDLMIAGRVRSKGYVGNRDKISYSAESKFETEGHGHRSALLIRWYDPDTCRDRDHYLYGYIRESFDLDNLMRFSLLISSRFGPAQNTVGSTRLRLETVWRF